MQINRIKGLLKDAASDSQFDLMSRQGFMVNPFAPSLPAWQVEIYREAFLQAQKKVQDIDFPWAECWN